MESNSARRLVTFESLRTRLITRVNARIRNGEFTERGLARILSISQPQMHNVLKGARKMNHDLADRFLLRFGMSVVQLLEQAELTEELVARPLLPLNKPAHQLRSRKNPERA